MAGRNRAAARWPAMLRAALESAQDILRRHHRGAAPWMPPTLAHLYRVFAREPARVSVTRYLALTFRFVVGNSSGVTVLGNAPAADIQEARTLLQRLLPRPAGANVVARGERQPRLRLGYVSLGGPGLAGAGLGDARTWTEAARPRARVDSLGAGAARAGPGSEAANAPASRAVMARPRVRLGHLTPAMPAPVIAEPGSAPVRSEVARLRAEVARTGAEVTRTRAEVTRTGAEVARARSSGLAAGSEVMRPLLALRAPRLSLAATPGPSRSSPSGRAPLPGEAAAGGASRTAQRTAAATSAASRTAQRAAAAASRSSPFGRAPLLGEAAESAASRFAPSGRAPRIFLPGAATASAPSPGRAPRVTFPGEAAASAAFQSSPPGVGRPLASPVVLAHARPPLLSRMGLAGGLPAPSFPLPSTPTLAGLPSLRLVPLQAGASGVPAEGATSSRPRLRLGPSLPLEHRRAEADAPPDRGPASPARPGQRAAPTLSPADPMGRPSAMPPNTVRDVLDVDGLSRTEVRKLADRILVEMNRRTRVRDARKAPR